ncbi:uncharacterized protein NFIA_113830 [Aspergillus fischeri NRRL 181]|uniref:Uncharacterized protein n=1 Tax=Neosartorya fischeri (strain ATCC 1020 / DSM 3700 / CBS 544.65 / FGSC A1164 / JCM 1740 / NRRL 181 / WB 181) TaxID=331117 RepID=A1D8Z1_NEOFI|nr:uncharacterized protein NFIA_113830 [Aspergillus fischeri NRRL 181]EAW20852.1 hypothetical protein NFIA_113830 [Aspergillus fischeri NRRL 181]KAG2010661.1 hypothetical protein GB937_007627 [Aspergillus fischeri]
MCNTFSNFVCNAGKHQLGLSDCHDPSTKTQPYVKITTAKMLAQLLSDATFIDISNCFGILQNIFDSNNHIDVRSEVVMAVLRLFRRAADFTSVFTAMASMANAASGPSEREAISEADWLAAEKGERPLPEVATVSDRPLFRCFLETAFDYLPEKHRREYLHKVLLPLFEESTRQHTRWIRCWALAYLHYPHVEAINRELSAKNKGWRGSTEGKHWLTLQSHLRSCRPFAAIGGNIAAGVQSQAEGDMTVSDLVEEYICRARIVSRHPLRFDKDLNRFVVSIEAILESLTILKGEVRSPAALPSRLQMDILRLPSPDRNPRTKDPAMELGRRLMNLVKKLADNPLLLVEFDAVKEQVSDVEERDSASFALLFGAEVEEDIARCALERIKSENLRQNEQLMAMIRRWKASSSEWVRQVEWGFDGTF